jgi:hypothetical protein
LVLPENNNPKMKNGKKAILDIFHNSVSLNIKILSFLSKSIQIIASLNPRSMLHESIVSGCFLATVGVFTNNYFFTLVIFTLQPPIVFYSKLFEGPDILIKSPQS